jgi:hypothetical protein
VGLGAAFAMGEPGAFPARAAELFGNTKTQVVVAIVWIVPVAVSTAGIVLMVVPRPAALLFRPAPAQGQD